MQGTRSNPTTVLLAVAMSVVTLLVMSLAVTACGYSSAAAGATSTVTSVLCPTPTAGASVASVAEVTRVEGHAPHTAQRVAPVTTLPPGVTGGQVGVVVEDDHHGPCETINLWAGNGLGERIYTTDHHSDCTIVTLERQVSADWQPVAVCLLATPTRIVEIASMHAIFVQLAPGALGTRERAWPAGTYRVAFGYHTGQQLSATADTLVYSRIFSIA
jgi:hypothetical protein